MSSQQHGDPREVAPTGTDGSAGTAGATDLPEDASQEQIERDIEQTRDRLADTVDQLAAKADVKQQASNAVHDAQRAAQETAGRAQRAAQETAGKAQEQIRETSRTLVQKFRDLSPAVQAGVAAGTAALIILVVVGRARKSQS